MRMPMLTVIVTLLLLSPAANAQLPRAIEPGSPAPVFSLKDVSGTPHTLAELLKDPLVAVMFVSTQCPISNDYNERMVALDEAYRTRGVRFVGINSNRQENVDEIQEHVVKYGFGFPVLKDVDNLVADAYGAQVTPEIFVVDQTGTVRYHGRIDDSRDPEDITTHDLRATLDALLEGKEPPRARTKAFGCGIKRVKK